MSKPFGISQDFRIVRPTRVQDEIWDAVESAIDAGWTPETFMREVRDDWAEYLGQKRKDDDRTFDKAGVK